jgi:hypothetical protein
MDINELKGLFVLGTLRSGAQFLGVVEAVDETYLHLDLKGVKKFVRIDEIAEMKAEPVREE